MLLKRLLPPRQIAEKLNKVKDQIVQCVNDGVNDARDRYKIKDLYYQEDTLEKELIASKDFFEKKAKYRELQN